ncbi:hypothetical protein BLNAU_2571 [Blattamonas nauphoetae]|uniref:Uncharacterized protein n=1 Tax=Blattamonas nauphoetae TaxID=2049346 RepID=A0ABQ9YEW5_9EUKA|nr:hypothetical protein BLNAU_2571 [Blattamonas nauphoetae]
MRFQNFPSFSFGKLPSYFTIFPFNCKAVLQSIKSRSDSKQERTLQTKHVKLLEQSQLTREDHLILHYLDALHLQYYAIMALGSYFVRHYTVSQHCIRQASIIAYNMYSSIGNMLGARPSILHSIRMKLNDSHHIVTEFLRSPFHHAITTTLPQTTHGNPLPNHRLQPSDIPSLDPASTYHSFMQELIHMHVRAVVTSSCEYSPGDLLECSILLEYARGLLLLAYLATFIPSQRSTQRETQLLLMAKSVVDTEFFQTTLHSPLSPFHHFSCHPDNPSRLNLSSWNLKQSYSFLVKELTTNSALSEFRGYTSTQPPFPPLRQNTRHIFHHLSTTLNESKCPECSDNSAEDLALLVLLCPEHLYQSSTSREPQAITDLFNSYDTVPASQNNLHIDFRNDILLPKDKDHSESFFSRLSRFNPAPHETSSVFQHLESGSAFHDIQNRITQTLARLRLIQSLPVSTKTSSQTSEAHDSPDRSDSPLALDNLHRMSKPDLLEPNRQHIDSVTLHTRLSLLQDICTFIFTSRFCLSERIQASFDTFILTADLLLPSMIVSPAANVGAFIEELSSLRMRPEHSACLFRILIIIQRFLVSAGLTPSEQIVTYHWVDNLRGHISENPNFTFDSAFGEASRFVQLSTDQMSPEETTLYSLSSPDFVESFTRSYNRLFGNSTDSLSFHLSGNGQQIVATHPRLVLSNELTQTEPAEKTDNSSQTIILSTSFTPSIYATPRDFVGSLSGSSTLVTSPEKAQTVPPFKPNSDYTFAQHAVDVLLHINTSNTIYPVTAPLPPSFDAQYTTTPGDFDCANAYAVYLLAMQAFLCLLSKQDRLALRLCSTFTFILLDQFERGALLQWQLGKIACECADTVIRILCSFLFELENEPGPRRILTRGQDTFPTGEPFSDGEKRLCLVCLLLLLQITMKLEMSIMVQQSLVFVWSRLIEIMRRAELQQETFRASLTKEEASSDLSLPSFLTSDIVEAVRHVVAAINRSIDQIITPDHLSSVSPDEGAENQQHATAPDTPGAVALIFQRNPDSQQKQTEISQINRFLASLSTPASTEWLSVPPEPNIANLYDPNETMTVHASNIAFVAADPASQVSSPNLPLPENDIVISGNDESLLSDPEDTSPKPKRKTKKGSTPQIKATSSNRLKTDVNEMGITAARKEAEDRNRQRQPNHVGFLPTSAIIDVSTEAPSPPNKSSVAFEHPSFFSSVSSPALHRKYSTIAVDLVHHANHLTFYSVSFCTIRRN